MIGSKVVDKNQEQQRAQYRPQGYTTKLAVCPGVPAHTNTWMTTAHPRHMDDYCSPRHMDDYCSLRHMDDYCSPRHISDYCSPQHMDDYCSPRHMDD
ncbi:hypothetical protein Pcinc_001146 [Petrolisthes cinctipes]|uniref:Uncharacterized protein n=1 Tax=Petrolisthes cinctipes TaxID=88211 RepID=A0AAE1GQ30_PETCI|nr:hypothetical protein Pcinc_002541 [Petrolisthes cinctipes]KAK3893634.1 hypothetical protein Pcinc_002547 [Petrolisthes cinctipes]KAK3895131.1 hypothetical protein Pcinc_001146 [Petrolisthes cinctipes]